MSDPDSVINPIKRALRFLVVATVVLYLAIGALIGWTLYTAHGNQQALCALRTDLKGRVAQSEKFLRQNPHGTPGIPVSLIKVGIQNQRATIDALSGLNC